LCACEVSDYDHSVMEQKLHAECCFAAIESIQRGPPTRSALGFRR